MPDHRGWPVVHQHHGQSGAAAGGRFGGRDKLTRKGSIRILSTTATFSQHTWTGTGDTIPSYVGCDLVHSVCCDPTGDYDGSGTGSLTAGSELAAWAQHIQNTQTTEGEFQVAPFETSDFSGLPQACGSLVEAGSSAGVCICPTETTSS